MGHTERIEQSKLADKRLKGITFGDPITNVCAGEFWRHGYFVRRKGKNVQVTNGKGKFGDFEKDVIFKGHLSKEECERLFTPIWEAHFK